MQKRENPFNKPAAKIYKRFFEGNPGLCPQNVRTALSRVGSQGVRDEESYYIAKIVATLSVITGGLLLVLLLVLKSILDNGQGDVESIVRKDYGGITVRQELLLKDEAGKEVGVYQIEVAPRKYTQEEAQALFLQLSTVLPDLILKDNKSLQEVSSPLSLPEKVQGYPFVLKWASSNYAFLKHNGTVVEENLSEEGEQVTLKAEYACEEYHFTQEIPIKLVKKVPDETMLFQKTVEEAIKQAEENTAYEADMLLPSEIDGRKIRWSITSSSSWPLVLLLVIVVGVGLFFARDSALMEQMKKRRAALQADYAGFVSRVTLYLGAGMSVRAVFEKLAEEYTKARKRGDRQSYLYEEISRTVYAMESGIHEEEAYNHFATGCDLQEYTRFAALLSQNLRKGQGRLLEMMKSEAAQAGEKHLDEARIRGEQAGTKLMFPMMLMLVVVMLLIMVPAYMSF